MNNQMNPSEEVSEIVFFDTETTFPYREDQPRHLLEFGAIFVNRRTLVERDSYSTVIRPADLNAISPHLTRCNRALRDAAPTAPTFIEVADKIYDILNGRVWAGHNIVKFDWVRIQEAFAAIGRQAPEPKGIIDTLPLLSQWFGKRTKDMKMDSLAKYFGRGEQAHRSLDDVRMNIEVLKCCSTVLFLESRFPDILTKDSWASPNSTTRNASRGGKILDTGPSVLPLEDNQTVSHMDAMTEFEHEVTHLVDCDLAKTDPFEEEPNKDDVKMEEVSAQDSLDISTTAVSISNDGFLQPDEVSVACISVARVPSNWGQTIQLLHKDVVLQLYCPNMTIRFGMSKIYFDNKTIVLDSTPSLCKVLDACDQRAHTLNVESGSGSSWNPVVTRNNFFSSTTIRLKLTTNSNESYGSSSVNATEIFKREPVGIAFHKFDPMQLHSLFVPGDLVDAFFTLSVYDYQQYAGISLVATKLIIN